MRCGATVIHLRLSLSIAPHSAVGGCTPAPRKLRLAPVRMATGKSRLVYTLVGPSTLGRMWRRRIVPSVAPSPRAASTNASSRRVKTIP